MSGFTLSALNVGNGVVGIAPMPGRSGDYKADLQVIREFAPGLILTMVMPEEMVSAPRLGFDLQGLGARWFHFPVTDYGAPRAQDDAAWARFSLMARSALSGGGRVMVHCRGGCGRSGMAVLRLMVETGEVPEAALKRLRAVRECAVETDAQRIWAFGGDGAP